MAMGSGRAAKRVGAVVAAGVLVGAWAGAAERATAHEDHPLFAAPQIRNVELVADNGSRVDVVVSFEIINPTDHPVTLNSVTARGGAVLEVLENGAPALPLAEIDGVISITPPSRELVIRNVPRVALEGAGLMVSMDVAPRGRMDMLVRLR